MQNNQLLIILGATASGKTKLAVRVAYELNGEIISADSRQIFKRMDIGTGKDLSEYRIGDTQIPYHLIDILEPGERYHVDAFKNDFYAAFADIHTRHKLPILCGGTGMYIHSILQNQPYTAVPVNEELRKKLFEFSNDVLIDMLNLLDKKFTSHVDKTSKKRLIRALEIAEFLRFNQLPEEAQPNIKPIVFGIKNEVEITRVNILSRLDVRLKAGMIDEVEQLIKDGVEADTLVFYGLEYKFITQYLNGDFNFDELKLKLGTAICQYAKRQNTFFRKMEKDGVLINWLDAKVGVDQLKEEVLKKLSLE